MKRIDYLNKHLETLVNLNNEGGYSSEIRDTLSEIEKELGLKGSFVLSSYPTAELHEELVRREGIKELQVNLEQEAVIGIITGEIGHEESFKGPVRILVNQD